MNDYPDRIYVEASCGRWTYYQLDEIDRLQGQLNLRGVREAKLHEKINLALRNNPMKLGEPRTSQEQPERQKQSVLG